MNLRDILPKEEMYRLFDGGITFEEYTFKDIDSIKEMKAHILFGLTMYVWNRIVRFNLVEVDPSAVTDYIERKDPDIYRKASSILGADIIKDLYYVKGQIEGASNDSMTVSELLAARIYPNNLHLADISFILPEKTPSKGDYNDPDLQHEYLLYKLIDNAVRYGKSKGCNYLMLTLKSSHYVKIFSKCGFMLEDPLTETKSVELGMGIPMLKLI